MAIVMDYIAKCGCRIRVDDSDYATASPEEIERRMDQVNRAIDDIRWNHARKQLEAQETEGKVQRSTGG